MTEQSTSLLRKMAARRAEQATDTGAELATAWSRALPKAAQSACGLTLAVTGVDCDQVTAAGASADMADRSLLCLLEGAGGAVGLMVMDPAFFGAFVAFRMTGRVTAPDTPRPPTRVDARLASGLVTAAVQEFGRLLGDGGGGGMAAAMGYSGFLADARLAQFAMPDGPLSRASLSLRIGPEAVEGQVQVLLPPAKPDAQPDRAPARPPEDWAAALSDNVHAAPMLLSAQLAQMQLPLSQLLSLQVGQKLTLPGNCLDNVVLQSGDGRTILSGRLGRASGDRAVRVHREPALPKVAAAPTVTEASNPTPSEVTVRPASMP